MSNDETPVKPIEVWAEEKGEIRPGWDPSNWYVSPQFPQFAPQNFTVAIHIRQWGQGRLVTEAEFDAAITEAANIIVG